MRGAVPDEARDPADGAAPLAAARAAALRRLVAGLVHDVNSPLNSMVLHLAILGDKLAEAGDGAAAAAAGHLDSLRQQVRRVNEVVRSFAEAVEPASGPGGTDLGGLAADAAERLRYEARRREVEIACRAEHGAVRAHCDAARAGPLVVALLWKAVAESPAGSRVEVGALADGAWAVLALSHPSGPAAPGLEEVLPAASRAAAALGGALGSSRDGERLRWELRLPRAEGS